MGQVLHLEAGVKDMDFRVETRAGEVMGDPLAGIPATTGQEVRVTTRLEAVRTRSSALTARNPITRKMSVSKWTRPGGHTTNSNPLKREPTVNLCERKVEIKAQLLHLEVAVKGGMGPHNRDIPAVTRAGAVKAKLPRRIPASTVQQALA